MLLGDRFINYNLNYSNQLILLLSCLVSICNGYTASAQVIPDRSLGSESSTVTNDVTVKDALADLIEGGAIRDNNLFHSFEQFSVGNGDRVYFASPNGIANILTRVTGNNISEIFGTLGVLKDTATHIDGSANLFLLNPNGIVFGENAALDVSGSFLATTAESYIFENDFAYGAQSSETPPLLTVNIPVGIQFGAEPQDIQVRGTGNNLAINPLNLEVFRDFRNQGLLVPANNTLALLGGNLNLEGGNLTSEAGRIELGSIGESKVVAITPTDNGFTFGYENIDLFGDINLTQAASIDVSGDGNGNLQIQASNLALTDNSMIIANTLGAGEGQEINIVASESISIIGGEFNPQFPGTTAIFNQLASMATGKGGNLNIETSNLQISNGGLVNSTVQGEGVGGNITISTDSLQLLDGSQVATGTVAAGNSGNLNLTAKDIKISGTSAGGFSSGLLTNVISIPANEFFPGSIATGDGGNLTVTTESLEVSNDGRISSTVQGDGDGGNVTISTDSLQLLDGGQVNAGTVAAGNSGNLDLTAKDIKISGTSASGFSSGLFTSVESQPANEFFPGSVATGNGGNLTVTTDSLQVSNQGQISSSVSGEGDGGDVTISTNSLQLLDGSQVTAGTVAAGNSGNLSITAQDIKISGASAGGFSSGLFTNVQSMPANEFFPGSVATGNGGNLTVTTDSLQVSNQGQISSSVGGEGDGGNTIITANTLQMLEGGQIGSATFADGNAGELTVNAAESVTISGKKIFNDPRIDNSLNFLFSGLFVSVEQGAAGNGGNLILSTAKLNVNDGGLISANTTGAGKAGNLNITADTVEVKNRLVNLSGTSSGITSEVGTSATGDGGNIKFEVSNLNLFDGGLISAASKGGGDAGNIDIAAQNITLKGISPSGVIDGIPQTSFPAEISAVALGNSDAGSIKIDSTSVQLQSGATISVSNLGNGNSGNLNITATELNLDRSATLEAQVNRGNQGNINLVTDNIFLDNQSKINANATRSATGGNIVIDNTENIVVLENSQIIANAIAGNGGNIEITTQGYFVSPNSLVSASSKFGLDGAVEITNINGDRPIELNQLPIKPIDGTQQITTGCGVGGDNFMLIGKGGLPENPGQYLRGRTIWQDLRLPKMSINYTKQSLAIPEYIPKSKIIEAQAWKTNQQGNIELVAQIPLQNSSKFLTDNYRCLQQISN